MQKLLFLFFLVIIYGKSHGQHITDYLVDMYPESDSTFDYDVSLNQVIGSTHLSSGLLWDKASPNISLDKFDVTNEVPYLIQNDELRAVYFDVRRAFVNTPNIPAYDSLLNLIADVGKNAFAMPLLIIDYDLQKIDSSSFSNGNLNYANGQINVLNSNNPFTQFEIFGAAFAHDLPYVSGTELNFRLDDRLFFTNTSKSIETVQIRVGEGEWVQLVMNSNFILSFGQDNAFPELELLITYTDNSTSRAKWRVATVANNCSYPEAELPPWAGAAFPIQIGGGLSFVPDLMFSNGVSGVYQPMAGKVYVKYRSSLSPQAPRTFKKPIILVEGLDLGEINMSNFVVSNQLGFFGWPQLWNCEPSKFPTEHMPGLLNDLVANDYDIIFLDFYDGAGRIESNGLLLQELITRVNQHKVGNDDIVLWGVSMGGQIARWTLLNMEANNLAHCVRLFVAQDSPWKGAALPASAMMFFKSQAKDENQAATGIYHLNKYAAKQLLLHHTNFSSTYTTQGAGNRDTTFLFTPSTMASPEHYAFYNEVNALGNYPRKTRNVAFSNGNINGNLKYSAGETLLYVDVPCAKLMMYSEAASNSLVLTHRKVAYRKRNWMVSGLPNFSGAPGGTRNDLIKEFRQGLINQLDSARLCSSSGVGSANHEEFSFIPTISALNLNTSDIFLNVYNNVVFDNPKASNLTEFASIYGPAQDELHGAVNPANIAWLNRQIYLGENKVHSFSAQLATLWNNPTENKYLRGFTIANGGHFKINGVGNVLNLTQSGSLENPLESHSDVQIGSPCSGSTITMDAGSTMTIGEVINANLGEYNTATLSIGANSVLEVKAGSSMSIMDFSNIIVEQGGTLKIAGNLVCKANTNIEVKPGGVLIYEGNIPINLEGSNSVLIIKGTLQLAAGAELTTIGNGYIHWKSDNPWQLPAVSAQSTAKFKLQGSSPTQVLSIIDENIVLVMPNTVDFDLSHGKIISKQNSELLILGKCNMLNARLGGQSGQIAKGVKVMSSKACEILYTHFEYSTVGLEINQTLNTNHAHLIGNHFKNNQASGLIIQNKGALIGSCQFVNNNVGLSLIAVSSIVNTYSCTFSNNAAYGISAQSTNFQPLLITGCSFVGANTGTAVNCIDGNIRLTNNVISGYSYGLVMEDGIARATCNNISGAILGIEILPNASLNIGNDARNLISNNQVGIYLHNSNFLLTDGKNNLSNNSVRSLQGFIRPRGFNRVSLTHQIGTLNFREFPIGDNLVNTPIMYPSANPNLVNADFDLETYYHDFVIEPRTLEPLVTYVDANTIEPVFYVNNQPNFTFQTCGQVTAPWYDDAYPIVATNAVASSIILNSNLHNAVELKDAIRNALSLVSTSPEDIKNDLLALNLFKDILSYNYGSDASEASELLVVALEAMTFTLSNAFSQGVLPMNYGAEPEPLSDYFEVIIQNLTELISANQGDSKVLASLTVELALVYRFAGHYETGLGLLASQEAQIHQQRDYWACMMGEEWDLSRDIITIDQFNTNIANCANLYAFRKMKPTVRPKSNFENTSPSASQLVIYPNPTSTSSSVIVPDSGKSRKLQINNQQGVMVKEYTITAGATEFTINSSDLIGGVYTVVLLSDNKAIKASKWVVIK